MEKHPLLGYKVRDRITGFTGTVTGVVDYLSGCNQALVVPKLKKDGTVADSMWFDVQRLEVDVRVKRIKLENGQTPGFDMPPPVR